MRTLLRGQRSSARILVVAVVASAGGCGASQPELLPASGYTSRAGKKSLAVESRGGVTVTGDGSVWHRSPANLPDEVTPVWVTVHNTTGQPVRVQYDEFSLKGPSGDRHAALAPYAPLESPPTAAYEVPDGGYFEGFEIAPYLAPSYPWLPVWEGPLPHGPSDQSVAALPGLPTAPMVDRALPEGVLENDGTASGFLYFQKLPAKKGEVRLEAVFQEPAEPGQPARDLSSIDIPFHRVSRRLPPLPTSNPDEGPANWGAIAPY